MTWGLQMDAFLAELTKRASAIQLRPGENCCLEFASCAAQLADAMGIQAECQLGIWHSPFGLVAPHAWVLLDDDLIIHCRRRTTTGGLEVEVARASPAFEVS